MKLFKKIKSKFNYRLNWLGIYNSPFYPPKIKFYFGEIRVGMPYFYPRYWSKKEHCWKQKKWFGFDLLGLGYKYKYDQVRYEWFPRISIILFNRQCVISFVGHSHIQDIYWEAFLTYRDLDKSMSKEERCLELRKQFGFSWKSLSQGVETVGDDAKICLKPKYLKIWKS
jgi:hypothetical protein